MMARMRSIFAAPTPRDIPDTVFVEYKPAPEVKDYKLDVRERLAYWMTVAIAIATGLLIYLERI